MSWSFFRNHQARRSGGGTPFPMQVEAASADEDEQEETELGYETREHGIPWAALESAPAAETREWEQRPTRFVDGKDVGRTVAWLRSPEGFPVPVRLGQIGAVVMRNQGGSLVREWSLVERVVAMNVDYFPWEEVEGLARTLRSEGFRLLDAQLPHADNKPMETFECEPHRKAAQNRCNTEMTRLERQAVGRESSVPTLVDGRLAPRKSAFSLIDPVVGLIKTHGKSYLQTAGQWNVLYDLRPAQRTPAFTIDTRQDMGGFRVVSFYVRLCDDQNGEDLNSGVVRIELTQRYFEDVLNRDWVCLDRLAGLACDYRCRDETYGRAAISIHPIVRAEESLGSLFTGADALISRFYSRTSL